MLVGKPGLDRLADCTVAVIGAGGVGGYAAEMIVRAGVGHLIVLDSDVVSDTNRNRQLLALASTVGRSKCEVVAERMLDINPDLDLVCIPAYLESAVKSDGTLKEDLPENTPQALLGGYKIDFLIDAIDTPAPKLSLIKYCMDSGIPLVSSMGAGARFDVTKVRIADISKSYNCPLAQVVRKRLRKMGIYKGFKVVFSEELADTDAIVPCTDRNKLSQVGTISYMPAVFGCACAQTALKWLLGM